MTVHDLITKLDTFPRFAEVVFDFTPAGSDFFVFAPVVSVEEIDIGEDGKKERVIALSRQDFSDDSPDTFSSSNN